MTTAVKRACDGCHRRKVKCDGVQPCRNCMSAQIKCTYNAVPQKKGPKGSRAKIIAELRQSQQQSSLSSKMQGHMNGVVPPSLAYLPSSDLLTSDMVKSCLDFFFAHMYPIMPFINRQRLETQVPQMQSNPDAYCLITSLCSVVMLQPGMTVSPVSSDPYDFTNAPGAAIVTATLLVEEAVRARKSYDYLAAPSLNTLATSYFLYVFNRCIETHSKAWYYLREAATLAVLAEMHKEETYATFDPIESGMRRRLYWAILAADRPYALQRRHPVSLQATIKPPAENNGLKDPLCPELGGFCRVVGLFRHFDDALLGAWSKTLGDYQAPYLHALQDKFTELQMAGNVGSVDVVGTQLWLRDVLSSDAGNGSFQNHADLSAMATDVLMWSDATLLRKLFAVTCDVLDALEAQPPSSDPLIPGPREHVRQLCHMLSFIRSGESSLIPLLLFKIDDVLPRLTSPTLQNAPEGTGDVDIFDGFGNAGMAQPPYLPIDDYDNGYSVPGDNLQAEVPGRSGSTPSMNDASSPYGPSPAALLSPISPAGAGPSTSMATPGGISMQQSRSQSQQQFQQQQQLQLQLQPQLQPQQQLQHQQQQQPQFQQLQQFQQQRQQQHQQRQLPQLPQLPQQHLQQPPQQQTSIPNVEGMSLLMGMPLQGMSGTSSPGMPMTPGLGYEVQSPGINPYYNQGLNAAMGSTGPCLASNGMPIRQAPQRSGSFAVPPQQPLTVGRWQALQGANSGIGGNLPPASESMHMGGVSASPEIDFNTPRW